jgi:hypothetical protein
MCLVVNKQEIFKQIHLYNVLQGVSNIFPELYSFQKKKSVLCGHQPIYLPRRLTRLTNASNFKTILKHMFLLFFDDFVMFKNESYNPIFSFI